MKKRIMRFGLAAVISTAALSGVLAIASPAQAQEPYGKYPTKAKCQEAGKQFLLNPHVVWECAYNKYSPDDQDWWGYAIDKP